MAYFVIVLLHLVFPLIVVITTCLLAGEVILPYCIMYTLLIVVCTYVFVKTQILMDF